MWVFVIEVAGFEGHDFKAMVIFFGPLAGLLSLRSRNTRSVRSTSEDRRCSPHAPHFRLKVALRGDASLSTGERSVRSKLVR